MRPFYITCTVLAASLWATTAPAQEEIETGAISPRDTAAVEGRLAKWPDVSRKAGEATIERYGRPTGATPGMLVWKDAGPWKAIILSRDPIDHQFPMPHQDVLEQVINYRVPPDKFDELAKYDGSVIVERTKGTMSARCDKEEMNYLALNLANDIVTGKRSVEDARAFYAKTAKAFKNGEKHPYTQRLQFKVERGGTADPDKPAS
jgi:hypothetical protein